MARHSRADQFIDGMRKLALRGLSIHVIYIYIYIYIYKYIGEEARPTRIEYTCHIYVYIYMYIHKYISQEARPARIEYTCQ